MVRGFEYRDSGEGEQRDVPVWEVDEVEEREGVRLEVDSNEFMKLPSCDMESEGREGRGGGA